VNNNENVMNRMIGGENMNPKKKPPPGTKTRKGHATELYHTRGLYHRKKM